MATDAAGDSLTRAFQRDVNCLTESDRNTRKRALVRLQTNLFGKSISKDFLDAPANVRCTFFEAMLQQPLLGLLADPVEKCRELALDILQSFIQELMQHCQDGNETAQKILERLSPQVWHVVSKRANTNPLVEPSEEIRCGIISLSGTLVDSCGTENSKHVIHDSIETLTTIVTRSALDNFPEAKNACSKLVFKLSNISPTAVALHYGVLLRSLVANMTHQRAKVRLTALEAIGSLVLNAGGFTSESSEKTMGDTVIPLAKSIGMDRAASVRLFGFKTIASWATGMPEQVRDRYLPHLVSSLLYGLADDALEIQHEVLELVENVAATVQSFCVDDGSSFSVHSIMNDLPEPFNMEVVRRKGYPTVESHRLVCSVLNMAIRELVKEVEDWTATGRLRAVTILRNILVFAGSSIEPFVPVVVSSLAIAATDEETNVVSVAMEGATLLGKFVSSSVTLPAIVPRAQGKVGSQLAGFENIEHSIAGTTRDKHGALCLILAVVKGLRVKPSEGDNINSGALTVRDTLKQVLEALDCDAIRDSDESQIQNLCIQICDVVVERISESCVLGVGPSSGTHLEIHHLIRVLLQLSGASIEASDREDALELLTDFVPVLTNPLSLLQEYHQAHPQDTHGGDTDDSGFIVIPPSPPPEGIPSQEDVRHGMWRDHALLLLGAIVTNGTSAINSLECVSSNHSHVGNLGQDAVVLKEWIGKALVNKSLSTVDTWQKASCARIQFDQLVRNCPTVELSESSALPLVIEILLRCTQRDREPDLRLSMLALLESVLKLDHSASPERAEKLVKVLNPFAPNLVIKIMLPHLVWSAGRVASTMRKVSMYCFLTLLKTRGALGFEWIQESLSRDLIPAVRTCLDDQDTDTRKFTCLAVSELFSNYGGDDVSIGEELTRDIYHDLIKRLDDASDAVRVAACLMLEHFVRAAPSTALKGTAVGYMVDTLMIHLDDDELEIRQAVLQVLREIKTRVDCEIVLKRAQAERSRHRDPSMCDRLLAE